MAAKSAESPRKLILAVGRMISGRIGRKMTVQDPEYQALCSAVSDEMASLALKMKVRNPRTLEEIATLAGKSPLETEALLSEMADVGLVVYNRENLDGKNPNHEKRYEVPLAVPGGAEIAVMSPRQLEEHPEMAVFLEYMSTRPLEKVAPKIPPGGAGIGRHVIPVEKAIKEEPDASSVEYISHWLLQYGGQSEGKFAVSPCACRLASMSRGEGCGDDPEDWCISLGDMADFLVETKRARYVTFSEVQDILRRAEENGFVHQITNIDGEDKIFGICNCNVNACYGLRAGQMYHTPNLSRSAYVAHVNWTNCTACGECVAYCPSGAVKLGQKLCDREGKGIIYPVAEVPGQGKWDPRKWSEDYRDKNRKSSYDTGTSPCQSACPAHVAVQGYLKLASEGRYRDALALIKKNNPFPAVCGRVCNRPCEDACTRGTVDAAVAIEEVKKYIAQLDLEAETRYIPPVVQPSNRGRFSEKIAIIGAGPAGLSCAYFLAEKGYAPVVFEKNSRPGGMLRYGIPSYKLEKEILDAEIDVLRQMGVEIRCNVNVGKDVTLAQLRLRGFQAFYIAIGCQTGKKAGVPGEDAKNVVSAVDFLHAAASDVSCSVRGRAVVIGGGNVAVDTARTASRCGAESVTIYCLEQSCEMPADPEELDAAAEEGVNVDCGWGLKEIQVERRQATGVVLKRCTAVYDSNGHYAPTFDEKLCITIPCENVFISAGQSVAWGNLLLDTAVQVSDTGEAVADPVTYQTAQPDVFVGGDVYTGPEFAISAIAAGKEGAISLHRFVRPGSDLAVGRRCREYTEMDTDNIRLSNYADTERQIPAVDEEIDGTFRDARLPFTEEQVKAETARCLGCGTAVVDPNQCLGCGICTTKCAFDAIHLYRDNPECSTMIKAEDARKAVFSYAAKRKLKRLIHGKNGS